MHLFFCNNKVIFWEFFPHRVLLHCVLCGGKKVLSHLNLLSNNSLCVLLKVLDDSIQNNQ